MPHFELSPDAPPSPDVPFECVLQQQSGCDTAWIRPSGELDLATAPQLAAHVDEALSSAQLIMVDLRQLSFMDSTGLAVLVTAHARARRSERRLVLIRGPRQVDRLLQLTGLIDRLEITDLQPVGACPVRVDRHLMDYSPPRPTAEPSAQDRPAGR